jgi:hypothetical protein
MDTIVANLRLRYSPSELDSLTKDLREVAAQAGTSDVEVFREHLACCIHVERLCYIATRPELQGRVVKEVTMFKPDLLHLSMRTKITLLRRAIDQCLLARTFAGGIDEQKRRVSEVENVLNDIVNTRRDSPGAIK